MSSLSHWIADIKQLRGLVQSTGWQVRRSIPLHMRMDLHFWHGGEQMIKVSWLCVWAEETVLRAVQQVFDCSLREGGSFRGCQQRICPPPPPSCWAWFSVSTPTQRTKNRLRTHAGYWREERNNCCLRAPCPISSPPITCYCVRMPSCVRACVCMCVFGGGVACHSL